MRKIDLTSALIIGACIVALIFLIYKTSTMDKESPLDQTLSGTEDIQYPTYDDSYPIETDTSLSNNDNLNNAGPGTTSSTTAQDYPIKDEKPPVSSNTGKTTTSTTTSTAPNTSPASSGSTTVKSGGSSGSTTTTPAKTTTTTKTASAPYKVVAGSFSIREGADKEVARLRKLGYPTATVSYIDTRAYAKVIVNSYTTRTSAEKLVQELAAKGVNAYVLYNK